MKRGRLDHGPESSSSQGLVEFSLVLVPFLLLLMGIVDVGRAVYMNNGVAEAAREIARATSVHPCDPSDCALGKSPEAQAVIATQRNLVPGLAGPGGAVTVQCTSITDAPLGNATCKSGNFVRVTVSVPFGSLNRQVRRPHQTAPTRPLLPATFRLSVRPPSDSWKYKSL